jgi:hypothetical protein
MMADPSAHARKRMRLLKEFQGFLIFSVADECDKALNTDVCRAGCFARRGAALLNGISPRNCLRVFFIRSFPVRQSPVVFIREDDGANLRTFSAARTFGNIYKPRFLTDPGGKMSRLAFKTEKICIGEQFYIQMPADLDQFG